MSHLKHFEEYIKYIYIVVKPSSASAASHMHPDQGLNLQPFDVQDDGPPIELVGEGPVTLHLAKLKLYPHPTIPHSLLPPAPSHHHSAFCLSTFDFF